MSKERRNKILRFAIAALICAGMTVFTIVAHGYKDAETLQMKIRILADAFFIPGFVTIMSGFLVMVSNEGFFNGIVYAGSYAIRMLIPGGGLKKKETYAEFLEERAKKGKVPSGFLFIVGGAFLLVGIIFTVLFYCV